MNAAAGGAGTFGRRVRWLVFAVLGTVLATTFLAAAQNAPKSDFDHLGTGFALTGAHTNARCEGCHVNAVFKGTPRDCASCHREGTRLARGNVVIPNNHLPTQQACDACHKTQSFALARFSHAGVAVSGCQTCHNGSISPGKPATHLATTAACDSCHRTTAWIPASGIDHAGITPGTCATCHNGSRATGRPATHMPTGAAACDACHRAGGGWTPTKWNHTQVPVTAQCAACHSGGFPPADGRPPNHIPYASVAATAAANCDACHKGSTTTWANGRLHSSVTVSTSCASCHTGTFMAAVGKPANATHATVTGNCESCHTSTANWSAAKVDHTTYNAQTNCAGCHNGSDATGKPAAHMPTGTSGCFACHRAGGGWTPTKWNHTQVPVAAQCASCHSGGFPPADGRPPNHIPYATIAATAAANCDACHKGSTTTWANGRLHASATVSTSCASCHSGAFMAAVGKPVNATHATVIGSCESCHKSTASWTSGVSFAHSAANAVGTGTCDTCHNGLQAKGKSTTHVPVPAGVARCDSCHRSQASFATAVTMNHSVVTVGQCKGCHNGAYTSEGATGALAKPANHIPEVQLLGGAALDCNACHSSTASWGTQRMNHNNSQGNGAGWCKACHVSGSAYLGSMEKKSLTHEKSTGVTDCSQSGCHRPLGNKGAAYSKWD